MKYVIPGGSGQVGTLLARHFHGTGHEVVVLSRSPNGKTPWRVVPWNGVSLGPWVEELDGADGVINLAGRSVNCRYNRENRRQMIESRVVSTRIVGQAIAECPSPPPVWLQACTATIYAHRHDAPNDEAHGIIGGSEPDVPDAWHFSIDVAQAWERELDEAQTPATRKVKLRSAMTMSPDRGGIFDTLLGLVRRGLGGASGNGRQYVSWIHERDFIRVIEWLFEREGVDGVVNVAAPGPIPNREFMAALRRAWGIRFGLPASEWMLHVGALFMGTETELILKSRRVVPGRLLDLGFSFDFPDWPRAAADLCRSWRDARSTGAPAPLPALHSAP